MLLTVLFPIFDARGFQGTRSTRLSKPTWPLPVTGQQFVRRFGGIVSRRTSGLTGFFSEERVCNAEKALRLSRPPGSQRRIAFRQLFSDGDALVKFEVGFLLRDVKPGTRLNKQFLSSVLGDLLRQRVLIGESDHPEETLLVSAGRPLAGLYCKATTYRPKTLWSRLLRLFKTRNDVACFAGQPLVSVNLVSPTAKRPLSGCTDFGDAFLWTWDQKFADQTIKIVAIGETARRTSDLARNLRIFINRIHAELLASEYGLTAIEAELRHARTRDDVSESLRKLQSLEMKVTGLITRIERSISALCKRRSAQRRVLSVDSVLETIWGWRVDTVMDRYELLRENAARLHAKLPASRMAAISRTDLKSIFARNRTPALNVFMSYRREDTRDLAGRIGDFLERSELNLRIFRDLASIEPGSNWRSAIEDGIKQAHVILVIVGPNWLGCRETGRRRIDDPDDWVRYEVEFALRLKKRVVPVVLQGCDFPPKGLPVALRSLVSIQAFALDPTSGFDQDMRNLVRTLGGTKVTRASSSTSALRHSGDVPAANTNISVSSAGEPQIDRGRHPRTSREILEPSAPRGGPTVSRVLHLVNRYGLDGRAGARFVSTVEGFDAEVTVSREGETVGGTSIMGLMMLAAGQGSSILVRATGPEAAEVVDALDALVASRFGETDRG